MVRLLGHEARFRGSLVPAQTPSPTVRYFSVAHFCMILRASGLGGASPFPFAKSYNEFACRDFGVWAGRARCLSLWACPPWSLRLKEIVYGPAASNRTRGSS
jgi:hypothetical protein